MTDVREYWRLSDLPFSGDPDPWFFAGTPQKSCLAKLTECLATRTRGVLIPSEPQCGTTTLLSHLATNAGVGDLATQFVMTHGTREATVASIVSQLARGLGIDHESVTGRRKIDCGEIERAMEFDARQQIHTVWLADGLSEAVWKVLKSLSHCNCFSIVVAAHDVRVTRLSMQVRQPCRTVALDRFTLDDTRDFIAQSIMRVGGRDALFHPRAVEQLHANSAGKVGVLTQFAASSLAIAAREGLEQVTPHAVQLTEFAARRATRAAA
ncbi:hypothetical protein Pla52o_07770 [Novipirellula galeiformis]|uniref:AAA+ ATPase domain-containing protein n=1 Tax=Novipirellula galeiformis TaxID=2528004 RepID=A0A5C6CU49_9BACT|nr:hypothetical protein [Novipirellula galeiformis]TWU26921.1 hypothetical protein Pla52o_07770 [Novipirellula galeiformis]